MLLCTKRRRRRGGSIKPPSQSDLVLWGDGAFRQTLKDYVNLGGTGWVSDLMRGDDKIFTICLEFIRYENGSFGRYLFSIASDYSEKYIDALIGKPTVADILPSVDGIGFGIATESSLNTVDKFCFTVNRIEKIATFKFNNLQVQKTLTTNPNDASWSDFLLGARTPSNPEAMLLGAFLCLSFYDADGDLVEKFNFQEGSGINTIGVNGGVGVIGDGTPTNIWNEKINISKALDKNLVIVKKRDAGTYNANIASDATLTALGFTNAYITRAQLASLHNGTTIFTSPDDGLEPRVLAWPVGKVLTANEIGKANLYVRRYS